MSLNSNPIAFTDFAPDGDSNAEGAILDADGFYPTPAGYATLPGLVGYASTSLPGTCLGAFSGLVGAQWMTVLATANQLYVVNNSGVVVSQNLTLTNLTNYWSFDIFGNDLIATNGVDPPLVSTSGGKFAFLGGSPPIASIVQATDYGVFLVLPNSSNWIFTPNDTLWTPSIATATVSAALTSTKGNITAAKRLRSGIAMYKNGAIHMGQQTGPPFFWGFAIASDYTGTPGPRAVVSLGDVHYFVGIDDFYTFDGYSVQRIQNSLREWFFANIDVNFAATISGRYDPNRALIFWHFASVNASPRGTLDTWVCYSLRTGKWAKGNLVIDIPLDGVVPTSPGLTYAQFESTYLTYSPSLTYNASVFAPSGVVNPGVVISHILSLYTGASTGGFLTTFDIGDGTNIFQLKRAQPDFKTYPADNNGTLTVLSTYLKGIAPSPGAPVVLSSDGWFNLNTAGRMQRLKLALTAQAEVIGFAMLDVSPDGEL